MKNTRTTQLEKFTQRASKSKKYEEIEQEFKQSQSTIDAQANNIIKKAGVGMTTEEVGAIFTHQGLEIMMNWIQQANEQAISRLEERMNKKIEEMEDRIAAKYEAILEKKIEQFTSGMLTGMNQFVNSNVVPLHREPSIYREAVITTIEDDEDDIPTTDITIPRTPTGNIQWRDDNEQQIFNYFMNEALKQGWDGKSKMKFAELGKDYRACYQKANRKGLSWVTELIK